VYRSEDNGDGEELFLYKVVSVSGDHEIVSDLAHITCRLLLPDDERTHTQALISMVWTDFEACSSSDLLSANVVFKRGTCKRTEQRV
jgi:hypothetical protein